MTYLDDRLVLADLEQLCRDHTNVVMEELSARGIIIILEKSRLQPIQRFQWLDFNWDCSQGLLYLPLDLQQRVRKTLSQFIERRQTTRRLEQVLGLLQFCSILDPLI